MKDISLQETTFRDIKHNCNVSDARFWGYFSICGLLMRYRDLFCSERGLAPWDPIQREDIGPWISEKESQWPKLELEGFRQIRVDDQLFDPFDSEGINQVIVQHGIIYGAGYGMYLKPTFFVAELTSRTNESGHTVYSAGKELVRDLFSAPAMLQGRIIFLRSDPLRALLWDKYSQIRPEDRTMLSDAFRAYGMKPGQPADAGLIGSLDRIAASYRVILLRHELAESSESTIDWKDTLAMLEHRGAEHFLRAVQDLIADTSDDGPIRHLAEMHDDSSLLLYAGLLEGYRRILFPEIRDNLSALREHREWSGFDHMRRIAHDRFRSLRSRILELHEQKDRETMLAGILELSRTVV